MATQQLEVGVRGRGGGYPQRAFEVELLGSAGEGYRRVVRVFVRDAHVPISAAGRTQQATTNDHQSRGNQHPARDVTSRGGNEEYVSSRTGKTVCQPVSPWWYPTGTPEFGAAGVLSFGRRVRELAGAIPVAISIAES